MSYASDCLYKGYLWKNMPKIVKSVKACEIIVHLPCLTDHDRETILTKSETRSNYDAMVLLTDCLKRRENWPEQFITALEECEHRTMAAEVRAEYDRLRGINNPSPPPPAANIVTAHVHPAPSAKREPDPGTVARPQPAVDVPSEAVTLEPLPIQETIPPTTPAMPAAPVLEVTTPPKLPQAQVEAQVKAVVVPPVTPPASPETPRASASPTSPPEPVKFIILREPEENIEPDIEVQGIQVEAVAIEKPQQEPSETEETDILPAASIVDQPTLIPAIVEEPIASITDLGDPIATSTIIEEPKLTTTPASILVEEFTQTITFLDAPVTTIDDYSILTTAAVEEQPRSPSPPMTDLNDTILTPEKPPVQDSSPPVDTVPAVVPDTKVVEIIQENKVTSSPPSEVDNDDALSNNEGPLPEEEDICFSKPGVLVSVEAPNQNNTTLCPPAPEPEPYSGDSGRLEMSEEAAEKSGQENSPNQSKPDQDISVSPAPSIDMGDVRESVGHVEEEPSNLNLDVQTPIILQANGETAEEVSSILPTSDSTLVSCNVQQDTEEPSIVNQDSLNPEVQTPLIQVNGEKAKVIPPIQPTAPSILISDNHQLNKPLQGPNQIDSEESTSSRLNTRYILTAAGVGACALLIAWRFKP